MPWWLNLSTVFCFHLNLQAHTVLTICFVCKIDLVVKYSLVSSVAYPYRLRQLEQECFCSDNISEILN